MNIWLVFLADVIAMKYPEYPFHLHFFIFVCFFIAVSAAWRWIAGLWQAGLPPGPGSAALRTSWVQNPNPAAAWSLYQSHPNNITDTPEQPASCWETGTYCAPTWLKKPNNRRRYWRLLTTLVPQSGVKTVLKRKKTTVLYYNLCTPPLYKWDPRSWVRSNKVWVKV